MPTVLKYLPSANQIVTIGWCQAGRNAYARLPLSQRRLVDAHVYCFLSGRFPYVTSDSDFSYGTDSAENFITAIERIGYRKITDGVAFVENFGFAVLSSALDVYATEEGTLIRGCDIGQEVNGKTYVWLYERNQNPSEDRLFNKTVALRSSEYYCDSFGCYYKTRADFNTLTDTCIRCNAVRAMDCEECLSCRGENNLTNRERASRRGTLGTMPIDQIVNGIIERATTNDDRVYGWIPVEPPRERLREQPEEPEQGQFPDAERRANEWIARALSDDIEDDGHETFTLNTRTNDSSGHYFEEDEDGNDLCECPACTEGRDPFVAAYHSLPRHDFSNEYRYRIGFEVEKEDVDLVQSEKASSILVRSHWCKERDSTLNGSTGFELVSPILALTPTLGAIRDSIEKLGAKYIDAHTSSRCGGHIHVSDSKRSVDILFDECSGYFPLLYAMYSQRIGGSYSSAKAKSQYKLERRSHDGALNITQRTLEFRIFPSPKSVAALLFRAKLLRLMLTNPRRGSDLVQKDLANSKSKLSQHLREVYRTDENYQHLFSRFMNYAQTIEGDYLEQLYITPSVQTGIVSPTSIEEW